MNSNKRLQSALEMLTTYGFMIALAAIALIILFYFATPTSQIEPPTCNAYGSIDCFNIQYYSNTITNTANVFIYLANSGSSPANVFAVNVVINGQTTYGTCTNDTSYPAGNTIVFPGANAVCSAILPNPVKVGKEVAGQFILFVQSCNSGVSQFSVQCGFLAEHYTGTFIIYANQQPSATVSASPPPPSAPPTTAPPVYYVPIVISNTGSSATPVPYQVMVTVASSSYARANQINSGWSNVEFTTGPAATGKTIQAWVESGPANTASSTVVWLKLTTPIPASSSNTVYMNFLNSNVMSASGPTGEAPQLSSTYAEYDNGARVFNFYDNFAGTSLPSNLAEQTGGSGSVSVNNELTFTTTSSSDYVWVHTPSAYTYPQVVDSLIETSIAGGSGATTYRTGESTGTTLKSGGNYYNEYSMDTFMALRIVGDNSASGWSVTTPSWTFSAGQVLSFEWAGTGSQTAQINYATEASGTNTLNPVSNYYGYWGLAEDGAQSFSVQWIRMRSAASTTTTVGALTPENTMVLDSVPITLTNSQTSATPAPFQQLISIPSSSYSAYINSQWTNVEFTTGNSATGTVLQAWVESNPMNTASSTQVWVNLPSGIQGESSITIYMNMMAANVMSASGPTGEAPQLYGAGYAQSTYAEYDNGADVFTYYTNFAGTSIPSGWSSDDGATVTINNGATVVGGNSAAGWNRAGLGYDTSFSGSYVFDTYAKEVDGGGYNVGGPTIFDVVPSSITTGTTYTNLFSWSTGSWYWQNPSGTETGVSGGAYDLVNNVYSVGSIFISGAEGFVELNYGSPSPTGTGYTTTGYIGLAALGYSAEGAASTIYSYWARVRTYPPNGVMPTASIGATTSSAAVLYYVPITLTNSQTTATAAPFQQLISIDSNNYNQYINGPWNNIEFTTLPSASGTVLQAWVESNPSNTATSTTVWVRLPSGIPASSSITIYMNMMAANVMSASGPTGEAPGISPTYGLYDNGAYVFNQYWNFAGTSLPTGVSSSTNTIGTPTYGSVTVNNGVTLNSGTCSGCGAGWGTINMQISEPSSGQMILDAFEQTTYESRNRIYLTNTGESAAFGGYAGATQADYGLFGNGQISSGDMQYYWGGWNSPSSTSFAIGTNNIVQTALTGSIMYFNILSSSETQITSNSQSEPPLINVFSIEDEGAFASQSESTYYWIRTRAYPPNGVMPSNTPGAGASTTQYMYFSANPIPSGVEDTVTAIITPSSDSSEILYCSGLGCTPSTVFVAGAGTISGAICYAGNSCWSPGTYVFKACDTTASLCTATSTLTITPANNGQAYVPITITNPTTNTISAGFQDLITIPSNAYSAYINYPWNNVEFTYTNPAYQGGTVIPAWIESGAYNTSTATNVWLYLGNPISGTYGSNTVTVYMNFMSSNVLSASGPTGEAPQLSSTYGQYDNGAEVFNNYWNFAGTSTPTGVTTYASIGSISQNNGLTIIGGTSLSSDAAGMVTSTTFSPNVIIEYYGSLDWSSVCNYQWEDFALGSTSGTSGEVGAGANAGIGLDLQYGFSGACGTGTDGLTTYYGGTIRGGSAYSPPLPASTSFPATMTGSIFSLAITTSSMNWQVNYQNAGSITGTTSTVGSGLPISINQGGNSATAFPNGINVYWLRARAYPALNLMPLATFGSIA